MYVERDVVYSDRGDSELMARWQQGDAAAFAALFQRWQRPIARFISRMLGPRALVDDFCQEVFLRVHEASGRYREKGAFSSWLYRIALNVTRDACRKQTHAVLPLQDIAVPDSSFGPAADCARRETAERVAAAIAELPEALRLVLVLHHYEELNFEQIASLTGTPASTLKSRFAAALTRLRCRLRQLGCSLEETSR
jgi:RNA polymerase sigma-70 factor (ECF subfamily)